VTMQREHARGQGAKGRQQGVQNRAFLRQPPLPRHSASGRRPKLVSEINVAQPALSQGSATVSGMGHLLGYARVSTTDQQPHRQVDALERAGCYRVFTETASGARADRGVGFRSLQEAIDTTTPAASSSSMSSPPWPSSNAT
jgi:hypothetical protein